MKNQEENKVNKELTEIFQSLFDDELKNEGFSGEYWKHGWLKTKKASIFIKNPVQQKTTEDLIDGWISKMKDYSPVYPAIIRKPPDGAHLFVVDIADAHFGKYANMDETDNRYTLQIAHDRCLEGLEGLIQKTSAFDFDMIALVIGNDILHVDNPYHKTTAGTNQDTDGMWHEAFDTALNFYVQAIERLITLADVQVIFNPSNHDFASGYMLSKAVEAWFHNNKNVHFDVSIKHRKYFKYGVNMIATSHGDGAKEANVPLLMAQEAPQMWSDTKYRYCYLHHIHHKKKIQVAHGKDYIGVTVEYLRSPSATDSWHHRNGYVGKKAIEGFVHHPEQGQVHRVTHYF